MSELIFGQIENGVPLPKARENWSLVDGLEAGQSVVIQGVSAQRICNILKYRKARHGRDYTTKKVEGGIRVWRTK